MHERMFNIKANITADLGVCWSMLAPQVCAALIRQLVRLTTDPVYRDSSRDRLCGEGLALTPDHVGRGQVCRLTPTALHIALDDISLHALVPQLRL